MSKIANDDFTRDPAHDAL